MRKLLLLLTLLATPTFAQITDPITASQNLVNATIQQNTVHGTTSQAVNNAFNSIYPILRGICAGFDASGNCVPNTSASSFASLPSIPNNAGFTSLSANIQSVIRNGYTTPGDGGRAQFNHILTACTLNSGSGDGGTQIRDAAGTGCWVLDPSETVRPELFGPPAGNSATSFDDGPRTQLAYNGICARSNGAGGTLQFAAHQYYYGASTVVMNSCAVTLRGSPPSELPLSSGTWLHINSAAKSPFVFNYAGSAPTGTVAGSLIENIGVYQDQPTPVGGLNPTTQPSSGSWAPTPYPFVFVANSAGKIRLENVHAAPVYDLLFAQNAGRLEIGNVSGQIFHRAFTLDSMFDVTHLTGKIHFWPFWSQNNLVYGYQSENADVFYMGRVDGMDGGNVFAYSMHSMLHFTQTFDPAVSTANAPFGVADSGYATGFDLGSFSGDGVQYAIQVDKASLYAPQHYPQRIHINHVETGCFYPADYGMTDATANSSGFLTTGTTGAIELSVASVRVSNCGRSPTDTVIVAQNTSIPSMLRFGTFRAQSIGTNIFGLANPTVSTQYYAGAPAQNVVEFGTVPQVYQAPLFTGAQATLFQIPRFDGYPVLGAANNGKTVTPWQYASLTLSGTAGSTVTGYQVTLPVNPWDQQDVTYSAGNTTFTSLSFVTSDGTGVTGASATLNPFTSTKLRYILALNSWVKVQ